MIDAEPMLHWLRGPTIERRIPGVGIYCPVYRCDRSFNWTVVALETATRSSHDPKTHPFERNPGLRTVWEFRNGCRGTCFQDRPEGWQF